MSYQPPERTTEKKPDPGASPVAASIKEREPIELDLPDQNAAKFPWLLALLFLGALSFVHVFSYEIWLESKKLRLSGFKLVFSVTFVVLALVGFLWLARQIYLSRFNKQKQTWKVARSLAIGFCGLVVAFGVHDAVKWNSNFMFPAQTKKQSEQNHLEKDENPSVQRKTSTEKPRRSILAAIWRIVLALLLAIGFVVAFEKIHHTLPEKQLSQIKIVNGIWQDSGNLNSRGPSKHLILPLTAPNWVPEVQWKTRVVKFPFDAQNALILKGDSITDDIESLNQLFTTRKGKKHSGSNWQQILRAVQPHLNTLESIWIFGSNGSADHEPAAPGPLDLEKQKAGGSAGYAKLAAGMIELYLRNTNVSVVKFNKELHFQSYPSVDLAIQTIIRKIKANFPEAKDEEIVIDTTGGLKTSSISAAAATFNQEVAFQYVDTAATDQNVVILYSVRNEHDPKGEWGA